MPVGVGLVPHSVKPHASDLPVVGQQLAQLSVHEIQVRVPVACFWPARLAARAPARKIVRRMPIKLRVVKKQLDALLVTFRRKHADHVFAVGSPRHHVPIRQARIKHRESIMMLRSDGDVFHSRGLRQRHPRRRVKLDGIEKSGEFRVVPSVYGTRLHHPFPVAQLAVHSPVNEHPEFCILKPAARFQVGGSRSVVLLCIRFRSPCKGGGTEKPRKSHGSHANRNFHFNLPWKTFACPALNTWILANTSIKSSDITVEPRASRRHSLGNVPFMGASSPYQGATYPAAPSSRICGMIPLRP